MQFICIKILDNTAESTNLKIFFIWLNILHYQQFKEDVSKYIMQFTIEDKHLTEWLWSRKNYGQKCSLEIFFTEDEVLLWIIHDIMTM